MGRERITAKRKKTARKTREKPPDPKWTSTNRGEKNSRKSEQK